jgi:hypothetical protein
MAELKEGPGEEEEEGGLTWRWRASLLVAKNDLPIACRLGATSHGGMVRSPVQEKFFGDPMDGAMRLHGLVFLASQTGSHPPCQATLFLI